MKELNKTDLHVEIETIKKKHKGRQPGDRKPKKEMKSNRCKHHQQNTREERISCAEDAIDNIDTIVKENYKWKYFLTQNIQQI